MISGFLGSKGEEGRQFKQKITASTNRWRCEEPGNVLRPENVHCG